MGTELEPIEPLPSAEFASQVILSSLSSDKDSEDFRLAQYELAKHFQKNKDLFKTPKMELALALKKFIKVDPKLRYIGPEDVYLVPYGNTITSEYTIHRLKAFLKQHPDVEDIDVGAIKETEQDYYIYEQTKDGSIVISKPIPISVMNKKNSKIVGAYATIYFTNGRTKAVFVDSVELGNARNASKKKTNGPWDLFPGEMAKKTAFRRLKKELAHLFESPEFKELGSVIELENKEFDFNQRPARAQYQKKKITQVLKEEDVNFRQEGSYYVVENPTDDKINILIQNSFIKIDEGIYKRGVTRKAHDKLENRDSGNDTLSQQTDAIQCTSVVEK